MATVIVVAVKVFDFEDDKGRTVRGSKLVMLDPEGRYEAPGKGCPVTEVSMPFGAEARFESVPGIYDIDFEMAPGARGQARLRVGKVRYRSSIDFADLAVVQ